MFCIVFTAYRSLEPGGEPPSSEGTKCFIFMWCLQPNSLTQKQETGEGKRQPDRLPRLPQLPPALQTRHPSQVCHQESGLREISWRGPPACVYPPGVQLFCFQVQHKLCLAVGGGGWVGRKREQICRDSIKLLASGVRYSLRVETGLVAEFSQCQGSVDHKQVGWLVFVRHNAGTKITCSYTSVRVCTQRHIYAINQ